MLGIDRNKISSIEIVDEQPRTNWPLLLDYIDSVPISSFLEGSIRRAILGYQTLEEGIRNFHREIASSLLGQREIFRGGENSAPSLDLIFVTFHAYPDYIFTNGELNSKDIVIYQRALDRLNIRFFSELNLIAEECDENINQPELIESFSRAAKQCRFALQVASISQPSDSLSEYILRIKNYNLRRDNLNHHFWREEFRSATDDIHKAYFNHLRSCGKGGEGLLPTESLLERLWLAPHTLHHLVNRMGYPYKNADEIGMHGNLALRIDEMQNTLDYAMLGFVTDSFGPNIPNDVLGYIVELREAVQKSIIRAKIIKSSVAGASEVLLSWLGKWW